MNGLLAFEQVLNGLQAGILLFLVSAGLTLTFGVLRFVNLAHAALFMLGAYFAVSFTAWTGSLWVGGAGAILATVAVAVALERVVVARLYRREPLVQLLATFGLVLFFDEAVTLVWGPAGLRLPLPQPLAGAVMVAPGLTVPVWRLVILAAGIAAAAVLAVLISRTRAGMWIRAGAADPAMAEALGVNLPTLFTAVFALGAALSALAGVLTATMLPVRSGMGNDILVFAFVVVVVGGLGSLRGALAASLALGLLDTVGRAGLSALLGAVARADIAAAVGPALSSMLIYVALAVVLAVRPHGLFPEPSR